MSREAPCVIRLLAEGASLEIFGRQQNDGSWRFRGLTTSLEIGDDGDDTVQVGGIPWYTELAAALPDALWIRCIPMQVHPALRGWFRDRYAAAVASLPASRRTMHAASRHGKWQAMFESTPPDRWSVEDGFHPT